MLRHHVFRSLALVAGILTGVSCADYTAPTSPVAAKQLPPTLTVGASFSYLTSSTKARAVRWAPGHSQTEQSVSTVVGPEGGTLSLPGSDFSMSIPSGALVEATTITVVAKAGPYVAYEMPPHGLRFLKTVTAVQGLRAPAAYGTDAGSSV